MVRNEQLSAYFTVRKQQIKMNNCLPILLDTQKNYELIKSSKKTHHSLYILNQMTKQKNTLQINAESREIYYSL
jgi:hypothetical protein